MSELPEDSAAALVILLQKSGLQGTQLFDYVSALLMAGQGWTAHAHWRARETDSLAPLISLIALRCALDLIAAGARQEVAGQVSRSVGTDPGLDPMADPIRDAAVWQAALEQGYRGELMEQLADSSQRPLEMDGQPRPEAQFVFCIDVRSERMRRALESVDSSYRTYGFAGFFGAAISYESSPGVTFDQCPVLIKPAYGISASEPEERLSNWPSPERSQVPPRHPLRP